MNRQQLVDAVAERLDGDRRTAAAAVEAVLDTVTATLAEGERVALFGFGVFETVDRAARTARNPATGGTVDVPATSVPRFRPGQALKDAVRGRPAAARRPARAQPSTAASDVAPAGPKPDAKATTEVAKGGKGKSAKDKGKDKAKAKDKGAGKKGKKG